MTTHLLTIPLALLILIAAGCAPGTGPASDQIETPSIQPNEQTPSTDSPSTTAPAATDQSNAPLSERVTSEEVTTADVQGFVARPTAEGTYPGIVMIHEWWGLNDNIRQMARILAAEGYNVFAVDLYGEATTDRARAGELATNVRENQSAATAKLEAATTYLRDEMKSSKVASLGWCFGGGQSLQLALNEPMDATVVYYGTLVTDKAQLQKLGGPVLGIFGADDTSIPVAEVETFDRTLDELQIKNAIHVYPDVGHAFANPTGENFAPEATRDAWQKTLTFLNENLKSAS